MASYNYDYMNRRVSKSVLYPAEARSFAYDLGGNMLREKSGAAWREYIYLGGHRLAMIAPETISAPGIGGCGGAGCSIGESADWKNVSINALIFLSPLFVIVVIKSARSKRFSRGAVVVALFSGGIVAFSYISTSAQTSSIDIYWYINDHLDTPQKMVDEYANIVNEVKLDPFGKVMTEIGTVENNFRFPGQYHDRETGLYYNWNRYYVPGLGRYLTVDPVNIAPLFAYSLNNPIRYLDYDGLITRSEVIYCALNPSGCALALACREEALNEAKRLYPNISSDDNEKDAFRHCRWTCCMAQNQGESWANKMGKKHESFNKNPKCKKEMDIHNNEIGATLGAAKPCGNCSNMCQGAKPLLQNKLKDNCDPCGEGGSDYH